MIIAGLQKMSLLDYPEKVSCVIFTYGCNLRCPFCHNSDIVVNSPHDIIPENAVFNFLKTRVGLIDGVVISGGEPLLNLDIIDFAKEIKNIGFSVKVDTNGTLSDRLISLCESGYVDYVAMDVKNSLTNYSSTCGIDKIIAGKIVKSIQYLIGQDRVDYEFRTTVTNNLHGIEDIEEIARLISGCKRYYIQNFVNRDSVIDKNCSPVSEVRLAAFLDVARSYIPNTYLRGVELNDHNRNEGK